MRLHPAFATDAPRGGTGSFILLVRERVRGLETEQRDIRATTAEAEPQEALQPAQSLGALLKTERERLGLSREQITEKTRMRAPVVEAIENEAWASLPPAVFVRGFLRSYAKVLGVSQDTVMGLYAKSAPAEHAEVERHPKSPRSRRRAVSLVLLGIFILAMGYGMWRVYPTVQGDQGWRDTERKDQESALQTIRSDKEWSRVPSQSAAPSPSPIRAMKDPPNREPAEVQSTNREPASIPQEIEKPAGDQAGEEGGLSLTGIVKERTWLRIRIDGKEEKEYLFLPGSRPQWKGRESFYMLIGNASGIDLELNGKKLGPLGSPGQVIRLTLPKDVEERERNH